MQAAHASHRWSRRREQYNAKPLTTSAEVAELATGDDQTASYAETSRPNRARAPVTSATADCRLHEGRAAATEPAQLG